MAEEKCLMVRLHPKFLQLRDSRTYTEAEVKEIMFGFARDLGCKWSDNELRTFIESAFDF